MIVVPVPRESGFTEEQERLSWQRYLVGKLITEADWRLFTTLIRYDAVYYNHLKTNKKRLLDYPSHGHNPDRF